MLLVGFVDETNYWLDTSSEIKLARSESPPSLKNPLFLLFPELGWFLLLLPLMFAM